MGHKSGKKIYPFYWQATEGVYFLYCYYFIYSGKKICLSKNLHFFAGIRVHAHIIIDKRPHIGGFVYL